MKKIAKILFLILLATTLVFSACNPPISSTGGESSSLDSSLEEQPVVEVVATEESLTIEDIYLSEYDFTTCFTINEDGQAVEVKEEYLDISNLKAEAGVYTVYCNYLTYSAQKEITVIHNEYLLTLTTEEITINYNYALDYDYLALFTASVNGTAVEITEDMIETNISTTPGVYEFTVKLGNQTKTLIVTVTEKHDILVVVCYKDCKIAISELDSFDYTTLFSMFVDGYAVQVTADMIDLSSLSNAVVGDECEVVLNYTHNTTSVSKSAKITVVGESEVVINAKSIQTYPNSGAIDLTTLFTISKGDKNIPVTLDMISGSIDYSKAGNNSITLTYNGQQAVATVEVVIGVVISYAKSDTIVIKKGTNQSAYAFAEDFVVYINGLRFTMIESYLDLSAVDFSTAGTYTAKLVIPYNEKGLTLTGGVNFTYYEKSITYQVVENEYKLTTTEERVVLKKGTTSYNPFRNINLSINGINQGFTENPDYVDKITCYAQIVSAPIDFSAVGVQEVVVEVFVNGVNSLPVTVSFEIIIESDIVVTATNRVVFTGETVKATSLFTITEGGEEVETTFDMIEGKIDTFNPGVYIATVNYKGIEREAKVVVLDREMQGVYKTNLYAIPDSNASYDEEYGETAPAKKRVGSMVISETGEITIKGVGVEIIDAVDANTIVFNYRSNEHTLYYQNGIIVIIPENAIKLGYYEEKRPYIYFNEEVWTITRKTIINNRDTYVLDDDSVGFSLDVFQLKNKITGEDLTYALKIALVSRISSDTIYQESWGEATFAEGFIGRAGETSAITFDGTTYNFTMVNNETGKIPKAEDEPRLFAGMTFKGTIDGQSATLSADGYQTYTLMIAGKQIFKATTYEINSMRNGGTNYVTNEVFLYEVDIRDDTFYSYKFKVDPVGKTFELVKRDNLFGYYETDNMYLMLDGYGTGFINFNSKSYYETQFTYTKFNNLVTITYKDTLPDFAYGEGAQFILDDFGNVLSVHSGVGLTVGEAFKNRYIQSGIIVNVNIETIGKESDAVAKAELYRAIEIINANGVVADSEKSSYIETKKVSFGKAGFYQLTIKATVYGETVTAYYSIQVLDPVFSENPLVAVYGAGVIYPEHSLIIDKYGRLTIAVADGTFVGSCRIISDNTFVAQVYGKQGVAKIEGNIIANGLVQIRATGALNYLDYYTTGKSYIVGTETTILRAFELKDQTVFILNKASTSVNGEVVTVELISGTTILSVGSIIKITSTNGDIYAKVLEMGNTKKGLQLEDGCRGTFTGDGEVLLLDGFGKAVYGDEVGTYVMNGIGYVTVYMSDNPTVYSINTNTGAYTDLKVKFDATLVIGKTFSAEYYFSCDDYIYLANTSFKFDTNGKVTVKSISSEHDGEDGCSLDDYAPVFCSTEGVVGSYSVKGTKVTVTVNGYTFVFNISNVLVCNELVCENNGGLSSDAHGYFASNSIFTIGA